MLNSHLCQSCCMWTVCWINDYKTSKELQSKISRLVTNSVFSLYFQLQHQYIFSVLSLLTLYTVLHNLNSLISSNLCRKYLILYGGVVRLAFPAAFICFMLLYFLYCSFTVWEFLMAFLCSLCSSQQEHDLDLFLCICVLLFLPFLFKT